MTDAQNLEHLSSTAKAAAELNEVSQPLGYAVTQSAGITLGAGASNATQRFTLHRLDKPVASGPSYGTAEEVRSVLDDIAKLPRWRIELANNPTIVFDPVELTVTDTSTDEAFCIRGWGFGVTGKSPTGRSGAYDGATHLSVNSENPPTVGRWHKSDSA